jgi:hypothetical protein
MDERASAKRQRGSETGVSVIKRVPAPKRRRPSLDSNVQEHIGGQLRAIYNGVLNEPIPDRFLELLEEMDRVQQEGAAPPTPAPSKRRSAKVR